MNEIRRNTREREYYWEWFSHSIRSDNFLTPDITSLAASISSVLKDAAVSNCLNYLSGFGALNRVLTNLGHSVIGYDPAANAVNGARILSGAAGNSHLIFLQGENGKRLKDILPHQVSAVCSSELLYEPDWHELKENFYQLSEIILPGGILIFLGAAENSPFAYSEIEYYDQRAAESIEWSFRDGKNGCTKLFLKTATATDYRDYKYLYIINNGAESSLESVEHRIPGYWNYQNIRELAFETGFTHFEARTFNFEDTALTLNIAYKDGSLPATNRYYTEEQPYSDF